MTDSSKVPPRRIYIAHPLRGDDSEEWGNRERNFERYLDEVEAATLAGYAVVSWAHCQPTPSTRG